MDTIFIRGLRIETIIGIYDWERCVRQVVVLDVEMAADIRAAAVSQSVGDTLDYHAIAMRLTTFIQEQKFRLLETLVERCAELLQREFSIVWLRLCVTKPTAVRAASAVGVQIERGVKPA
ncbi:MAG TPA: dihydroneopterin aldolase [Spongiibacteraceae bacterium]|nr:dihydroneopterin aldolase [Spongiibacteraceae bacterium]